LLSALNNQNNESLQLINQNNDKESHFKSINNNEDSFECSICLDNITERKWLKCAHVFCKKCIDTWIEHNKTCPTCRCSIDTRDI